MQYVKDHLYYHLGDELNVVDVDVEWPEAADGSALKPLQQFLASKLFGVEADNLPHAYSLFKQRYGLPVNTQFSTLPDDRKYCYVDCKLKLIAYNKGNFLSFRLTSTSVPAALSSQKADTVSLLFTYDLAAEKVLTMADVVRTNRIAEYGGAFLELAAEGANRALPDEIGNVYLSNACLLEEGMLVDLVAETLEDEPYPFTSVISVTDKTFFSKTAIALFKSEKPIPHSAVQAENVMLNGQRYVHTADEQPQFPGGADSLLHYLSRQVHYPDYERLNNVQGNVVVSFVVDADGQVGNLRVVQPVNPSLDREAVRVVSLLPRWQPAMLGGKPVAFGMSIPIVFKVVN